MGRKRKEKECPPHNDLELTGDELLAYLEIRNRNMGFGAKPSLSKLNGISDNSPKITPTNPGYRRKGTSFGDAS